MEEVFAEGVVNVLLNAVGLLQQVVDVGCINGYPGAFVDVEMNAFLRSDVLVHVLAGIVEDVSEGAVVYLVVLDEVGLANACHVVVVELQGAAQVAVDGRGREFAEGVDAAYHVGGLLDGLGVAQHGRLSCLQGLSNDVVGTLYEHLEHEAAHLAGVAVLGGVVVEDGDVAGALQQAVEIVGVDGGLVVDGGKPERLADGVGDEGTVVDAAWNVAVVAREQQHVVEV